MADPRAAALSLATLCIAFSLKHYLADFVLQTNWMARGKEQRVGWPAPLLAHVACHAVLTLVLTLVLTPALWWLTLIDFAVHLAIDRGKTLVSHQGGWKPDEAPFWWLLGFDQFLHQVTNIVLAAAMILL